MGHPCERCASGARYFCVLGAPVEAHWRPWAPVIATRKRESFMQVWRYFRLPDGEYPNPSYSRTNRMRSECLRSAGFVNRPPDLESIVMAHALVRAAARVVGIADPEQSRKLTSYVYRVSRSLIGGELADELKISAHSHLGSIAMVQAAITLRTTHPHIVAQQPDAQLHRPVQRPVHCIAVRRHWH